MKTRTIIYKYILYSFIKMVEKEKHNFSGGS